MTTINFFPGSTRDDREISIASEPAYGMATDLADFLHSMIHGTSASIAAEGIRDALEDGELLGAMLAAGTLTETELQEAVEELHGALSAVERVTARLTRAR